MFNHLFWFVPGAALLALGVAFFFFKQMMKESEGTDTMKKIALHVRKGSMAYLAQQYKVVALVFICLTALFAFMAYVLKIQNGWVWFAFLTGGVFSGMAGYFGMKTAAFASARTANAARRSLNSGLQVALRSGAVMGLVVVGLALLHISIWFVVLNHFVPASGHNKLMIITTTMLTFGMGASLQALFARVGGGIFTKAADVGADLVGKVEAGIPEDDPRNPATIADNVGDFVGDVAGMGADLFESFAGSILAASALGAAAFIGQGFEIQLKAVLAPMLVAAVGTVLSIAGIFAVRTGEDASQKTLMKALGRGVHLSSILVIVFSYLIFRFLDMPNTFGFLGSMVVGLAVGIAIGKVTEYYTSHFYRPTQRIAESAVSGPATVIISGVGTGMLSVTFPILFVTAGIFLAYLFAAEFDFSRISYGLYGIGMAAVGMLSTLGITLATDAYGPIADNAGGNAAMSGLGDEVRQRTDALDALGNTTAATGKGFAIGSAALTALALLASYIEELKMSLQRLADKAAALGEVNLKAAEFLEKAAVETLSDVNLGHFIDVYEINLMNPKVLIGMFLGAMMSFMFCGLTMNAVGRAAGLMVDEVRRQFREIKGILEGKAEPDYARCVSISTKGAQREMLLPSFLAIIAPLVSGLILGVPGVMGLLVGALVAGFSLAIFMANAGGAWDNAKKYIEDGNVGGKGSEAHKASIIGDTVGDPFKDTSGPSLNILIKLMSMVAIVMAGFTVAFSVF